jgi:predicted kinase
MTEAVRNVGCTGLPGTGKSDVVEAVGCELGIQIFAKDWLEAILHRCNLYRDDESSPSLGYISYELLTTLAQRRLRLGQSVILDSVAGTESIRAQWRSLATRYGAHWCVIECIWSDELVHCARLAMRQRHIPGWHELT